MCVKRHLVARSRNQSCHAKATMRSVYCWATCHCHHQQCTTTECCHGNATMCSFTLLLSHKIFRTAVNINVLYPFVLSARYFCPILTKFGFSRQIFHESLRYQISWKSVSCGSRISAFGRTDMAKQTGAFHDVSNAPLVIQTCYKLVSETLR